ncbi:MAG TPA: membrane protein insertion efficiency factor YidD [Pseudolabrys sp.]|nr:membrane protein insertion efficiency factor YidD [Pseudolabrys sp.]
MGNFYAILTGNSHHGDKYEGCTQFSLARLPRLTGRALIRIYRYTLSPLFGPRCRHLPSCSEYADEAINRFGLWIGGWMALARVTRCHPFGTSGIDNVPPNVPSHAHWWAPWRYGRWRGTHDAA